ncbi:MAG TPA: hypothetical protein VEY30_11260, partial [Myxococcaceae bacterium]|nr:hypothetical protein [Myxococcaceae bacterium]
MNGVVTPLNTGENFGHNFKVTFRLKYSPATFGSFKEMPGLEWNEIITMKEHEKSEWWEFRTNMYAHNPSSATLLVWPQRYLRAYGSVHNEFSTGKGSVKLLKSNGQAVTPAELGTAATNGDKTKKVQDYLKKHGGIMEIEVHDIPSILKPKAGETMHKERMLIFDCGLAGGGPRYKGWQYLEVDGKTQPNTWRQDAATG